MDLVEFLKHPLEILDLKFGLLEVGTKAGMDLVEFLKHPLEIIDLKLVGIGPGLGHLQGGKGAGPYNYFIG